MPLAPALFYQQIICNCSKGNTYVFITVSLNWVSCIAYKIIYGCKFLNSEILRKITENTFISYLISELTKTESLYTLFCGLWCGGTSVTQLIYIRLSDFYS